MDMRINAGYIITSSIHVGNTEFVLGVNAKAPQQFVTWCCNHGRDYYWGHYYNDELDATKDLISRAQEEVSLLEQRPRSPEKQKDKEWER